MFLCQLMLQTTLGVLKFHFLIFLIYIIRTLILDHTHLAKLCDYRSIITIINFRLALKIAVLVLQRHSNHYYLVSLLKLMLALLASMAEQGWGWLFLKS